MSDVTNEHLQAELRSMRKFLERIDQKLDLIASGVSNHADRLITAERELLDLRADSHIHTTNGNGHGEH